LFSEQFFFIFHQLPHKKATFDEQRPHLSQVFFSL
jgi:hypothetical protein